ncbi:LuxR C-terminal-related transcriptional regulator [Nocardia sp. BSTN01]|uniref:LuxR C-terminal-related transcriptional regulator n=1 Tax=Nocardia sp. BSTN01 TaxID=2783665 RepID=UPI0035CD2279
MEPAGRRGNCVAFDGHVAGGTATSSASAEQEDIVSELSLAAAPEPRPQLSAREVEVLLAWILGETKGEVCRKLFIAPGTVNTHLARIREKYRAAGRPAPTKAALLARALQDGYLDLDDI